MSGWLRRVVWPFLSDVLSTIVGQIVLSLLAGLGTAAWAVLSDLPGVVIWVLALAAAALVLGIVRLVLGMRSVETVVVWQAGQQPPKLPEATPKELAESYVRGRRLRVCEIPTDGGKIQGKTFEECLIVGPAILASLGLTHFSESKFGMSRVVDSLFWERPPNIPAVGAFALYRVQFLRCWLEGIGIVGGPKQISAWREEITPIE